MNNQHQVTLHAQRSFASLSVEIYAVERGPDGYRYGFIENGEIKFDGELHPRYSFAPAKPMLCMPESLVSGLVDELVNIGTVPSNTANILGQLKATQEHLGDMRKLVFKETQ